MQTLTDITIRDVTLHLFERYLDMNINEDCNRLAKKGIENIDFPIDKLNRWIGYIQAYAIINDKITVNSERDYTRPLFHSAYKNEGIEIPYS